jgi:hypothetical protein
MNIEAYAKAQKALVLLQEAVLVCVQEKPEKNTAEIGRFLRTDDFGGVEQKGHLTRAVLYSLKTVGTITDDPHQRGEEHHLRIAGDNNG